LKKKLFELEESLERILMCAPQLGSA